MFKKEIRKVVLVGTGMVGMSYAYAMMHQNICDELVLVDIDKKRAEGEAMDLTPRPCLFCLPHAHLCRQLRRLQ